ncbi:MAG: YbhN family protein, partial [Paracoccaceae bacterium]
MSLPKPVRPGRFWPLAQAILAIALLILIWRAADGPAALCSLATAEWSWLVLGAGALSLQTVLSALRWQLTARQLGIALGTGHAIREYYLAQAVNQSLPGGMIGDAGRAMRARGQAGLLASGQAVVFERLAGQIAMFVTLGAAFVATRAVPGGIDWPDWLALPITGLLAAGIALPVLIAGAARLPGAAGRGMAGLWRALVTALAARRTLPGQAGLSVGTTLCNLAAFAFCAR